MKLPQYKVSLSILVIILVAGVLLTTNPLKEKFSSKVTPTPSPTAITIQTIDLTQPDTDQPIWISHPHTFSWKPLQNIPDSAYLYITLSKGPTPGIVEKIPYPKNGSITLKLESVRNDDIGDKIQSGKYELTIRVFQDNFCDQEMCWNEMPNFGEAPLLAQATYPVTLVTD